MPANSSALSLEAPLSRRLWAWVQERFPPTDAIAYLVLYVATVVYARLLTQPGPIGLGVRDLGGFFALWAVFLLIRVLDEHKDYALDVKLHPQRVLQRGLITLGHLKVVGVATVGLQLAVCLAADGGRGPATKLWLLSMAYVALMTKEFFVGEWLGRHRVLYALSHLAAMPLVLAWIAQLAVKESNLPSDLAPFYLLSFLAGLAFEFARKLDGNGYAGVMPPGRARFALILTHTLVTLVALFILRSAGPQIPVWSGAALALLLAAGAFTAIRYARAPSAKSAKVAQGTVSGAVLASYLVLTLTMLAGRGVEWL
jgi:4-hydroxybenzoate polyprenyltransferase